MAEKFGKYQSWPNYKVWKKRLKNQYNGIYICPHKANIKLIDAALLFMKDIYSKASVIFEASLWKMLVSLSTYQLPYPSSVTSNWTVPSLYMEYKVVEAYKKYQAKLPQSKIDGNTNLWIMKPSFSSRGIGIRCFRGIKEVYARGRKVQAKIVQKYIENPLLLSLQGPQGRVERRKFDIRQWVLVTSMNPLVIYMFNSCYLKICGSEFSLDDIKDNYKHLSNYSVQRNNNRVHDIRNDLVMSLTQFLDYLKKHHNIELSWENTMFPKLSTIVKNTIYSACDAIEHRPNSFELYGFDFVIDEELNPWLIEVNSSPACCERTDWLIEMLSMLCTKYTQLLDCMADGLIDIIQPRLPISTGQLQHEETDYKWVKIYDMRNEFTTHNTTFWADTVEIIGKRVNVKNEKKVNRKLCGDYAATLIQKNVRRWLTLIKMNTVLHN